MKKMVPVILLLCLVLILYLFFNKRTFLFSEYENQAKETLKKMSLEEKIGQILLVRLPDNPNDAMETYRVGGFIFFQKDFENLNKEQVQNKIKKLQEISNLSLFIATDEEGGSVVRVSSNPLLRETKFSSPRTLYEIGGIEKVLEEAKEKNELLLELGINVNLAPVADLSNHTSDYMYQRSIGTSPKETGVYIQKMMQLCQNQKIGCTLKHFPGYGNNMDTHTGISKDNRSYQILKENDLVPFQMGIDANAESILVSHNIIEQIDSSLPASLSKNIHQLLRKDMHFSGVIMTDDLDMKALNNIEDRYSLALQNGNDLLLVTDYKTAFTNLKEAIQTKKIKIEQLDQAVLHVLKWKYALQIISQ